ncbi:hypothetical protein GOP47_0007077 [Adiantum capillus-veneris]|uniref:Uncharacterized protein n=1 Tax=Adiantum capillus-veneris TaxID=13818 RepID=A0A9D4V0W2_ADICA|nr:hypothetical protein GOP47_0007077 [Adiantum capillus-veneris]
MGMGLRSTRALPLVRTLGNADGLNPKMSSSNQKSNERQAARDQKSSARQVASESTSANAYNPISSTFHALESIAADTEAGYLNGRFKSIDDEEDNASSNGGAGELECMSNNGSYSRELQVTIAGEQQAHDRL